jgi:hypothetical protein
MPGKKSDAPRLPEGRRRKRSRQKFEADGEEQRGERGRQLRHGAALASAQAGRGPVRSRRKRSRRPWPTRDGGVLRPRSGAHGAMDGRRRSARKVGERRCARLGPEDRPRIADSSEGAAWPGGPRAGSGSEPALRGCGDLGWYDPPVPAALRGDRRGARRCLGRDALGERDRIVRHVLGLRGGGIARRLRDSGVERGGDDPLDLRREARDPIGCKRWGGMSENDEGADEDGGAQGGFSSSIVQRLLPIRPP